MNPVKIVLGIVIAIIGLSEIAQIFMISGEPYLDEEMEQIHIEEGVPLE